MLKQLVSRQKLNNSDNPSIILVIYSGEMSNIHSFQLSACSDFIFFSVSYQMSRLFGQKKQLQHVILTSGNYLWLFSTYSDIIQTKLIKEFKERLTDESIMIVKIINDENHC